MGDDPKKEFLEMQDLKEFEAFKKRYPDFKDDEEIRGHFLSLLKKHDMLETSEDHSDPREAFRKK